MNCTDRLTAAGCYDLHADGTPPPDPIVLARQWLPPDDEPERPRVTLATVGEDGCPDARTVLLTAFDHSGFAFHTAAGSRKTAELAAVPLAAMVVLWPDFGRQLVVRGDVVPDAADSVAAAWSSRSDYLRQLAWLNTDELAGMPLGERRRLWAEFAARRAPQAPAESWVGYRLRPREITFWAGRADTASRRLHYERREQGWVSAHRAG